MDVTKAVRVYPYPRVTRTRNHGYGTGSVGTVVWEYGAG